MTNMHDTMLGLDDIFQVLRQDSPRNIIFSSTRLLMKTPLGDRFSTPEPPLGITGIPFTAERGIFWRLGAFLR